MFGNLRKADHAGMTDRNRKGVDDRQDTFALLAGTVVVGTFISLMAGLVPLAIVIAIASVYAAKRVLSAPLS